MRIEYILIALALICTVAEVGVLVRLSKENMRLEEENRRLKERINETDDSAEATGRK